jgi:AraC-like DNA-binding protein
MIYKHFTPSPRAQAYIKTYHLLHFDFRGLLISPTKLYYPQAEQCLTFDPLGTLTAVTKQSGLKQIRSYSYLSGQQTSTYNLYFPQEYLMLKVVFQPGALFRFLGVPLSEFDHLYLDAESVIPTDVQEVNERLLLAHSYEQMIQVVDQYVVEKIKRVKVALQPIDKVTKLISEQTGVFSLDWIAQQACLSPRQLERKYLERFGVSPIVYNRILRFNKASKLKVIHPNLSWFTIAITCGYTDLGHLIKDFKQFSAGTPSSLANEEANSIHKKLNLG